MQKRNCKKSGLLLVICCLYLLNSSSARAQVSASMSGTVEDSSGAAIPVATITVTSLETGETRAVTTDEAGNYRVLSLSVGHYEIKAEKTGFETVTQTGIDLVVRQQAIVNLTLPVGAMQQQVTVTAGAPLVNTTTESISGLVNEEQVKGLPLNGRSFEDLITLNPGAVNYSADKQGSNQGFGNYFSVSGRRPGENLFLLNGVEYDGASQFPVTPGGVSGELLGIDAVREFNVVSSAYDAQYGSGCS
jgi:hypothetical protein